MDYWIPPDEAWVEAQVRIAMLGYKPPEITAEMVAVHEGDYDPLNLIGNPHRVTAAQLLTDH